MTKLADRVTRLRFETTATVRGREIIVEARPSYVTIKLKGLRHSYTLGWDVIHDFAARVAAERARKEKLAQKKARSDGR